MLFPSTLLSLEGVIEVVPVNEQRFLPGSNSIQEAGMQLAA
jgi:hypothetical protein